MRTLQAALARARTALRSGAGRLRDHAASRYVVGPDLADAVRVAGRLAGDGMSCTFGYWDGGGEEPAAVAAQYRLALDALPPDGYLSVKLTALGLHAELLHELLERASSAGRRVHADAMGPDAAAPSLSMIAAARAAVPDAELGCTLPGRWRRSIADTEAASDLGLRVRVVKGQWPDPADPHRDPRGGVLELVDALARRARSVSVATHDVPLMIEAVRRLRAAGTACDLELLYGLPRRASLVQAGRLGLATRFYLPFGNAYLPYALAQLRRRPQMAVWIARDVLASAAGSVFASRP